MRCSTKAAIFMLGPAIAYSLPVPLQTRNANATTEESSVLWWRDAQGVSVKFEASWSGCPSGSYRNWPFELSVKGANGTCGNAILSLNGQELTAHWDGNQGSGSGMIPGAPFKDRASSERLANWRSVCLHAPSNASTGHTAQVLTLTLDNVEELAVQDRIGFTVSFTNTERPEILRLSTRAVDMPGDELALEAWRDPRASERLETQDPSPEPEPDTLEDRIERELQKLQDLRSEAHELRHAIRIQEAKIRALLREDCQSLFSKWEQCRDLGCLFKVSLQTVPEIFRSIRYQFGSLQSQKLVPACSSHDHHHSGNGSHVDLGGPSPTSNASLQSSDPSLDHSGEINSPPPTASFSIPLESPTRDFFRSCFIFLLLIAVSALAFKILRNSTAFRRRRVDLAARREERRARRAYNSAARRLRWRQWWEGRSYHHPAPSISSSHSLPQIDHRPEQPHGDDELLPDPEPESEQGAMQAEILGLRRVLEFVGQLVRNEDDPNRTHSFPFPPDYPPRYEEVSGRIMTPDANSNNPRAGPPTTGMNSPRASSLMSLETTSSLTLETLDTLDSGAAPPSYHS
ncbi:hypothetical protein VTN77DRAFT_4831 [Rasamsonia byssochlamydoides]|uniref:uncharacterized protein n=1 Tax=Rasamsonia byssochlamydoides TaxID=89139 RepID=UPI0037440C93